MIAQFINGLERDDIHLVIEVRVNGARNGEEFLIVPLQLLECILAEVVRMRLVAMDDEDSASDFPCVGEKRHVHKGER